MSVGLVFETLPLSVIHVEVKKKGEFSSHLSPCTRAAPTCITIMYQMLHRNIYVTVTLFCNTETFCIIFVTVVTVFPGGLSRSTPFHCFIVSHSHAIYTSRTTLFPRERTLSLPAPGVEVKKDLTKA